MTDLTKSETQYLIRLIDAEIWVMRQYNTYTALQHRNAAARIAELQLTRIKLNNHLINLKFPANDLNTKIN